MSEGFININGDHVQTLEILFLTTVIALLPSLLVMMTSFTRYVISFSFLRSAIGTQQTPPNIVLIGIALFFDVFYHAAGICSDPHRGLRTICRGGNLPGRISEPGRGSFKGSSCSATQRQPR